MWIIKVNKKKQGTRRNKIGMYLGCERARLNLTPWKIYLRRAPEQDTQQQQHQQKRK